MRLHLPIKACLVSFACAAFLAACADSTRPPASTARGAGPGGEVLAQPSRTPRGGVYKIGKPYQIAGVWYYPKVDYDYVETGIASWYGPGFHGRNTANGEIFDERSISAAHRTLPLPSMVRVTNLENGRALVVRVNDRGPFKKGRIIDLSRRAAQLMGFEQLGTAKVRVEILETESRQAVAVAQGKDDSIKRPRAAPTVAVAAVPLDAAPSGTKAATTSRNSFEAASRPPASPSTGASRHEPPRPPGLWRHRRGALVASVAERATRGAPARQLAALPSVELGGESDAGVRAAEPETWPDGAVSQVTVLPSQIFIQAGSFLRRDYATRLSTILSGLGPTQVTQAHVNNRWFFRVRLGPVESVGRADAMLDQLHNSGVLDAHIIVE